MTESRVFQLREPVDVRRTLSVLRRGLGDPAYTVVDAALWRTTRMATGAATLRLLQRGAEVDVQAWGPGAEEALDSVPAMIGLHDDLGGFAARHRLVADAHRRFPGLRITRTGRVLEALIAAVIEQRVVGRDAFAAWRRLLRQAGEPAPGPAPAGMRVVPDAAGWAALASWDWHRAGVDPRRYRAAQACARVGVQLQRVAETGDLDATYRALRGITGVGEWTAAETGFRALGDADAVPFGDYHLGDVVGTGLLGRRLTDDAEVAELLEPYRPHRYRVVRLLELSPLVRPERHGPRSPRTDYRRI